ncbi:MAG TPA: glycerophosphodiester phosphodiesterase family protein [Blastocatellia bacterium]|nr:glycerophosphodiester phosphodiesterase family protein [Blastocatellia bacterium]
MKFLFTITAYLLATALAPAIPLAHTQPRPLLIAHRGSSGEAPEHTLAAYRLAVEQGSDFVEQDLQLTKDGALVCLHDADLARTTNVAEVFPDRAASRDPSGTGRSRQGWYTIDFTLAEIKRLDAGSWFNRANPFSARPNFAGERVPTLQEAIAAIGDRAGLYIEMKHYGFYKSMELDLAERLARALDESGFKARPDRILIQSFSKESLLRMRDLAPHYGRVQLLPMEDRGREKETSKITLDLAREISQYARGAGPNKNMIKSREDVALLQKAGLVVHPYTFRGATTAAARRPLDEAMPGGSTVRHNMIEEITKFVAFGIDGGFTDYPAVWREAEPSFNKRR